MKRFLDHLENEHQKRELKRRAFLQKKRKAELHKVKSRKRKEKEIDHARGVMKRAINARRKETFRKKVAARKARATKKEQLVSAKKLKHEKHKQATQKRIDDKIKAKEKKQAQKERAKHQKQVQKERARAQHIQQRKQAPRLKALAKDQQQQIDEIKKAIKQASQPEPKKWFASKKPITTNEIPPPKALEPIQEAIYATMKSIANLKLPEAKQNYLIALGIYNKLSDKDKEHYYDDIRALYDDRKHAEEAFKN
tara:strand:- start:3361 stop:4119 length:759 start_codon:yes stop_codon:yes gene_type:complete